MAFDDDASYGYATHAPVEDLEENDSEEELFKRRMCMRTYFNQLKMSLVRVRNAKAAKEEAMIKAEISNDTAQDSTPSQITDEMTPSEASAALEVQTAPNAAAVSNPPAKGAKKKAGVAKKKAVKKKAAKK